MPDTIADIIKEECEDGLAAAVGSPVNSGLTQSEQAEIILESDQRDFQRLGIKFLVPNDLVTFLDGKFNPFLAEPLLKEGSLLLDRCLQQRRDYQDLHTRWFEACVQIDEMFRLNDITKQEIDETDPIQTEILEADIDSSHDQIANAETNINRLQGTTPGWHAEDIAISEKINRTTRSNLAANRLQDGPMDFGDADGPHNSFGLIVSGAQYEKEIQRKYERLQLDIAQTQIASIKQSASHSKSKSEKELSLKNKLLEFRRTRNEVSRLVAIRRAKQLTKENGALNFFEQMRPIKKRFKNDLVSAWLRLKASHEGFQMLYGNSYSISEDFPRLRNIEPADLQIPELTDLPEPPPVEDDDFVGKLNFDDLVTWTQLTNTWLASILENQQQVTRSFSLKQLIDDDAVFEGGKAASEWHFRLAEQHFWNRRCVRMRTLAVQVDSGNDRGSWNISIAPPTRAIIRQNDGVIANLMQDRIGTLFLGRVNERTYAVLPEGSSPPKLYNASPIGGDDLTGEWAIRILTNSTSGATVDRINDIDIHLTVSLV